MGLTEDIDDYFLFHLIDRYSFEGVYFLFGNNWSNQKGLLTL